MVNAVSTPFDPSVENLDIDLGIDRDAPYHDFMVTKNDDSFDRVRALAQLQARIDSLPQTAATFRPTDTMPRAANFPNRLIEVTGAWEVPETYTQTRQNGRRFVNPNYIHARTYSEVVTKCDCGAVMITQECYPENEVVPGEHDHSDDCPKDYRLHARARLAEKRRYVVERGLLLGHSVRSMQDRLGLSRDSLAQEARELGLNVQALKEAGRRQRARTWVRLLTGYRPADIGKAYDTTGQTIRRYVNRYTDQNAGDLASYRGDSHE